MVGLLLLLGELLPHLLGLVLGGLQLLLHGLDLGVEVLDLRLELADVVLEFSLLSLELLNLLLLLLDGDLVLAHLGRQLVEVAHELLQLAAHVGEFGAGVVQRGLLGLRAVHDLVEQLLRGAGPLLHEVAGIGRVGDLVALAVELVEIARLDALLVAPVQLFEILLLELGGIVLEQILRLWRLHGLRLDLRDVLARLRHSDGLGRVSLLDCLRERDQTVLQLTVAVLQQLLLSVQIVLEIQSGHRDREDHVHERMQCLVHLFLNLV